ncbi:MFS transporter [Streptomyces sp. NPDC102462]|uniref:MFS transporter n=1 Tax=Streptomyces sp. NPDC102462 TaxID=3366178 RepID=UPI00382DDFD3
MSLWLQSLVGLSPVGAGLALTPLAAASFGESVVAGRRIQRLSPRRPIGLGLLLVAAGMLLLSAGMTQGVSATSPTWGLFLTGAGVGLATPVLVSAATSAVPPQRAGMAGGAVNTARQLGMPLAIVVLGAAFASRATATLTQGGLPHANAADALASGRADGVIASASAGQRAAMAGLAHRAFAAGLDRVFLFSALVAAVGAVAVLLLVRPAASVSWPRPRLRGRGTDTRPGAEVTPAPAPGPRTGPGGEGAGEQLLIDARGLPGRVPSGILPAPDPRPPTPDPRPPTPGPRPPAPGPRPSAHRPAARRANGSSVHRCRDC